MGLRDPSALPDPGRMPNADYYSGGGCVNLALAFISAYPQMKMAVEWYSDHGERAIAHAVAYDPRTRKAFHFNGTEDVDDAVRAATDGYSLEVVMDQDLGEAARRMGVRWSPGAPWDDDQVFDAWADAEAHWGLDEHTGSRRIAMPGFRTCEECGTKMPFGRRRNKVDGRLLCDGCTPGKRGAPGRPIGYHGSKEILTCAAVIPGRGVCGKPARARLDPGNTPVCGVHARSAEMRGEGLRDLHPPKKESSVTKSAAGSNWEVLTSPPGAEDWNVVGGSNYQDEAYSLAAEFEGDGNVDVKVTQDGVEQMRASAAKTAAEDYVVHSRTGDQDEEEVWRGPDLDSAIAEAIAEGSDEDQHVTITQGTRMIWANGLRVGSTGGRRPGSRSASLDYYEVIVLHRGDEAPMVEHSGSDPVAAMNAAMDWMSKQNSVSVQIRRSTGTYLNGPIIWSNGQPTEAFSAEGSRRVAHDSGDGETIYHCPFCGAGQVTARSDGTVQCGFCNTCFTVQVQPEHSSMPQTIDGVPVNDPSMPGDGTHEEPLPGQIPGGEPKAEGLLPGVAPEPKVEGLLPEAAARVAPAQVAASLEPGRMYYAGGGAVLTSEAYLRHLAIRFADDRDAVIDQVRRSR